MQKKFDSSVKRLFDIIAKLDNEKEVEAFFEDLCTIKEIQDMAQRFDTAIMLSNGENYQNIQKTIGVSTATISRVNRCLEYGADGYRNVINKLSEDK